MRLRLAFKLHGDEADLARQIADAAGVDVDKIAKLAMQRYLVDVMERATELANKQGKSNEQPSETNGINSTGIVSPPSDALSSQASGQP